MERWDKHWYGPIAAVRPYLFQRCMPLIVACDLLVLMTVRGARYGLGPSPFNVAHFSWLDQLHRLVLPSGIPTATYYVAVLTITSYLCLHLFLGGHRPWLTALVAVLYTYAWSLSRLDSYLHHYMLSLILACMVFFPRVEPQWLVDWWKQASRSRKRRAGTESPPAWLAVSMLAVACSYRALLSRAVGLSVEARWVAMVVAVAIVVGVLSRWNVRNWERTGPAVSAWAFRLLATTVGVIYIFTSIAKMDAEWCGGHTLRVVGSTEQVLSPVAKMAESLNITNDSFWSILATMVIPLELTLAVCYLMAARQDESNRKWIRRICFAGWLLAIGLHLNNEMMNLIIQWFGYYMLLLATIILLPARILMLLCLFFAWPECWLRDRIQTVVPSLNPSRKAWVLGTVSMMAIAILPILGFFSFLPGTRAASVVLAFGLAVVLIAMRLTNFRPQILRVALTSLGAGTMMILVVAQSTVRFDYHDLRGRTLQKLGNHSLALPELNRAVSFTPPSKKTAAQLFTNMGVSYRQTGKPHKAEQAYREAIQIYPRQFLAHYSLGNLLIDADRIEEAADCYRNAIAIKSDFSDAYLNLGNVLEFQKKLPEAIECYEAALRFEPNASDIQRILDAARQKLRAK